MFAALPGYQPVYNPSIPYLAPIGGLREGTSIYVHGTIPENTTRFFLNLLCGESEDSDIAFHLNPRFDSWNKVVFNTCRNGYWEEEEKIHHMPFHRGRVFEIVITATSRGYQVRVDGQDFHHFTHRVPMNMVRALHIAGDICIETINVIGGGMGYGMGGGMEGGYPGAGMGGGFQGGMNVGMGGGMAGGMDMAGMGMGYPGGVSGGMGVSGGIGGGYPGDVMGGGYPGVMPVGVGGDYPTEDLPIMCGQPIFHPTVPYTVMIPQGLFHRRTVIIRGMVPFGANSMIINFMVRESQEIAFHLNHRVRERILMRNSRIGGIWGQEETALSVNPFIEGQYFELSIVTGLKKFKVFVNGQPLFDFHHRFHFHKVDMLEIQGDVQLSYVHF